MPWMFTLDHTHYSRWLSVHIRDMTNLIDKHPCVLAEFKSGKFVVHKTSNKFSRMAIDQCHEQNTAVVKGSGDWTDRESWGTQTQAGGRANTIQDHCRV